jgi:hypothetical protein
MATISPESSTSQNVECGTRPSGRFWPCDCCSRYSTYAVMSPPRSASTHGTRSSPASANSRTKDRRVDSYLELGLISAPVTLIYGDSDWSRPNERERTQALLPNARVVTLKGTGHLASVENPTQLARIISSALTTASSGHRSSRHLARAHQLPDSLETWRRRRERGRAPVSFEMCKLYRDAKIGQIYEGTSNLQLQTIARNATEQHRLALGVREASSGRAPRRGRLPRRLRCRGTRRPCDPFALPEQRAGYRGCVHPTRRSDVQGRRRRR